MLWTILFGVAETTAVPAAFDLTKPEDQMKLVELSITLDLAVSYVNTYTVWTTVNIMACFLRCFKHFAVQVTRVSTLTHVEAPVPRTCAVRRPSATPTLVHHRS